MNEVIKSIQLDVSAQNRIQAIIAKQYDKGTRYLKVQLTDGGAPLAIAQNLTARINARRKDESAKAFLGEVNADGTVTVPITPWMLELDDSVTCDISIIGEGGSKLSTTNFTISVERANYADSDAALTVEVSADVGASTGITGAAVDSETFIGIIGATAPGTYAFVYGVSGWTLNSTAADLAQYGITVTGTPTTGDTVTVTVSAPDNGQYDILLTLISEVNAINVWESYSPTRSYAKGNKVAYNGSSYICTDPCAGVVPTDEEHWLLIAAKGEDGNAGADATYEEVSINGQLSLLSLPAEQVLDGKILLYRNNTYSDYDSSCNESGAAVTLNGTVYDISGKCKDDTYEADVTDGTVRWTEKRRKKVLSEVSAFGKSADGAFVFTDAAASTGSAFSSDDSVSVTVDGSTVKLYKDGITDAAVFKAYVKGMENLFSEFEELSSEDAGAYKAYAIGSSGTLAKTNTTFVLTSKPIPVSKENGNSVYIRYKSYTPQGVLKDDTYGRICRIRFYSDAAGTVPITTDGTFLSLALTTSNNTVSSMQIPSTAKSVRFSVYISDMVKDKNGNRINHGYAAGGVAWASLFWNSVDISSLEIKDFYVGYLETGSKPVSITYPVNTDAEVLTKTFVPMTDVSVSSTVHMFAGYRTNKPLKDVLAEQSAQIRTLDENTAKTAQPVVWEGYVERAYINSIAPDGNGGSYLKIEDAGEGKEGRRLYWKKVNPGEVFSVYSETDEPVVLAAMDKPPVIGYTPAIGSFTVKKNVSVSDDPYHSVSATIPNGCAYLVLQISSSSSFPTADKAEEWYATRFAKTTVSKGEPVGVLREEKYIPKERIEDGLINDPIQSDGEYYAIRKALQMSEVKWAPVAANMPTANANQKFPVSEQTGIPYSSVKAYNRFIGIDALLETFLTAVKNKNSVLYGDGERSTSIVNYGLGTDSSGYRPIGSALTPISLANENVGPYYGSVCSAFTGYCIGLPSYETTYSISHRASVTKRRGLSAYNCKRGDILLQQHYNTKGGHVIFVSDIERAKTGEIRYITTEESTIPVVKTERKEPRQFFDDSLSYGRNSDYQQNTILGYEELHRNVIREYDVKVLRGVKFNAGAVEKLVNEIVLDDAFDKVGCVYYICKNTKTCMLIPEGDAAVDGLHWEFTPATTDAATKDFSMPVLKIVGLSGYSTGKIVVSPLDTMKSLIVPEWAYNYRTDLMLDRGNRSQYRLGESVGICNATGNQITVSITGTATGSLTVAANSVGTYTPTVAGYYKVTVNGDGKTPLEFFAYNTGTVSVKTDSLSAQTIEGKIDGAALTDTDGYVLMKPVYVSLTTEKGIVGTTSADVSIEGSTVKFSIGKYSIPDAYNVAGHKFNCLKVHFETRHGRVITQPLKLWN